MAEPEISFDRGGIILDPKQLMQFAQTTTAEGRGRFADAVSQFFKQKELNETEQRLASDMMLHLLRQAETDLKAALSERLAIQENVPLEVAVFLANDKISVAKPVLQHSPVLKDIDLIYIIAAQGEEHWQTIAKREHLSPMVADRLIDTGDPATVLNLIDNQRTTLHKNCMKKIIKVSLKSEELQAPLLRRPEIDGDLAADLYMCVSDALRREIADKFKLSSTMIDASLDALVEELVLEAKGAQQVTPAMTRLARRFRDREEITPDLMIKTLRRGQVSFFISLFSEKTGFAPETVVRMIKKDSGKPFTLVCRSMRMMKSEFASMFLLSRGIRTGDKIVDQRELAMALKHYDSIKEFDMQRTVKSWEKNPELI